MSYVFETEDRNYEDFASGRVLYNQHGATSFPVRLGSEIFRRCEHILKQSGHNGPYSVYDPCCGGAYLSTVLGFLHGDRIINLLASDIDENMVSLAQRNLSLLTAAGIDKRKEQIGKMLSDYGKSSHAEALQSATHLKEMLTMKNIRINTSAFIADATKEKNIDTSVDMVITDLPYGQVVQWSDTEKGDMAVTEMLESLIPLLAEKSVVAVVSGKKTAVRHEKYKRVEHFQIGKRKVTFLQKNLP